MKPRDYQLKAQSRCFEEWLEKRSTLIVKPTGCGKTITFANIIHQMVKQTGKKVIIVADREELIFQARDKIKEVTGLLVDIEMGDYKASMEAELFSAKADVIVATRQTLSVGGDGGGRMSKFNPDEFCLLVIDEADGAVAATYKKIIEYFQQNSELKLLGVTATPDRADEEALGQVFESVAFNYLLSDPMHIEPNAIDDGWLVPVEQYMVSVENMDLSNIQTVCGDLSGPDLEIVLENEKLIQETVEAIFEIMHGLEPKALFNLPIAEWESKVEGIKPKRAIAFTRFVKHAEILSNILNRISPGFSNCISERTRREDRPTIINDFKCGKVSILCNADILTRGYDDDGVEMVFMCAPTKSRSKYAQRAGRATRPHRSIARRLGEMPSAAIRRSMIARSPKPCCTLIDFVGDSGRHKLCSSAELLAGNVSEQAIEAAVNYAKKIGRPIRMSEQLEEQEKNQQELIVKRAAEEARKSRLVAKSSYVKQKVDPFDVLQIKPTKPHGWDKGKVLSPGQRRVMTEHMGLNPDEFDFSTAKQIIDGQFAIWKAAKDGGYHACSYKMIKRLKQYGVDAIKMPIEVGHAYMDAIAKTNWRGVPDGFVPPNGQKKFSAPKRMTVAANGSEGDDIPF